MHARRDVFVSLSISPTDRPSRAKELFSGGAHSGFFYRQETHKIWFAFIYKRHPSRSQRSEKREEVATVKITSELN
jgi:hypothetical protein